MKILVNAFRYALFFMLTGFLKITSLNAGDRYFQQHISYDIKVTLDDKSHFLEGTIAMRYTNNSPDTLQYLWMHLWPNGYADRKTALGRQLLENGGKKFFFAKEEDRGYIKNIDFTAGGQPLVFEPDPVNIDVGRLMLNQPLYPGETVDIKTPFRVKIPNGSFSRLGHIGESYQVSQWYPKPAVYDRNGWHPMPYLDQGEFYSEFGSFKVAITLPENYVVAATGRLQEASEIAWLREKIARTQELTVYDTSVSFPPSSSGMKTITFVQDSIHDFAWFADKRFHVMKREFILPENGKTVEAWTFFTNHKAELWKKGLDYIESGVKYYSKRVGAYPYSHCTAVDGTISAGGGMEYPMITVIAEGTDDFELEDVIVHELGHNWFYGILGSNERDHGWMDEGVNSFYELEYVQHTYTGDRAKGKNDVGGAGNSIGPFKGTGELTMSEGYRLAYDLASFDNADQPVKTASEDFTYLNYGAVMYTRTALALGFLQDYLGTNAFDAAMQHYYATWKFKHPGPDDLEAIFETSTQKDLGWFFDWMLGTNEPFRYSATIVSDKNSKLEIELKNKTGVPVPMKFGQQGAPVQWVDGFTDSKTISLNEFNEGAVFINEGYHELLKTNGSIHRTRAVLPRVHNFRVRTIPDLKPSENTETLLVLPLVAWNRYNKLMAGAVFTNFSLIPEKFEFSVAPLYDFKNEDLAGTGYMGYHLWPVHGIFKEILLTVQGKRFSYANNTVGNDSIDTRQPVLGYSRIAGGIRFKFRKKIPRATLQHQVAYRNISIWQDEVTFERQDSVFKRKNVTAFLNFNELVYSFSNSRRLDPYGGSVRLEQGDNYCKIETEFKYRFSYAKFNKGVDIRFFAGGFLDNGNSNSRNNNFRMSGWEGSHDYLFEEFYFGRTDDHGLWKQQFLIRDGGFKTPTFVGQSNKWIASLNVDIALPVPLPISIFAGIGTYDGIKTVFEELNNTVMYEGGIAIKPIRDILEIYVPLFYSDDINTALETIDIGFIQQIRFVLNINKITPYALRNRFLELR